MRDKCVEMSDNANKMRDRLIELQCLAYDTYEGGKTSFEHTADVLLANGVVVSPCKVGDKIYQTDGIRVYESTISEITFTAKKMICVTENIAFDETAIGKSVFLDKKEVQAKLKGGE